MEVCTIWCHRISILCFQSIKSVVHAEDVTTSDAVSALECACVGDGFTELCVVSTTTDLIGGNGYGAKENGYYC
jgi:hypothetical protein